MSSARTEPGGTKVLFVTASRIGDAVLSTGVLDHLIRTHSGARVTIACGPVAAPLFNCVPGLERLIILEKQPLSLHWLGLWAKCVGRYWDVVVDFRDAPLTYLLGRRRRLSVTRRNGPERQVERYASALSLDRPPAPTLWIDDRIAERAANLIPGDSMVLAIGPTANWRAKTWRAKHFAELAGRLTGAGGILPDAKVALFGHESERPMVQELIDSIPHNQLIDLIGRIDLVTVYGCLQRCDFYVGNDSGLMHMAAASGTPTLGLFGPTRESRYGPWGQHTAVVRTTVPFEEIFPPEFDHANSGSLMDSLTVEMAEQGARELWSRAGGMAA